MDASKLVQSQIFRLSLVIVAAALSAALPQVAQGQASAGEIKPGRYACSTEHVVGVEQKMDGSVIEGRMTLEPKQFLLTLEPSPSWSQATAHAKTDPPFSKLVFLTKDKHWLWNRSFQASAGNGWLNLYRRSDEPSVVEFSMAYILDNSQLPIWRASYLRTGKCVPMADEQ